LPLLEQLERDVRELRLQGCNLRFQLRKLGSKIRLNR
jgi:ribosomal protein L29